MLSELSAPQFRKWRTFYALEPLADQRADWHAASICAAIWNTALIKVRSPKRFRVQDMLLEFTDEPKETKEGEKPARKSWQMLKHIMLTHFTSK